VRFRIAFLQLNLETSQLPLGQKNAWQCKFGIQHIFKKLGQANSFQNRNAKSHFEIGRVNGSLIFLQSPDSRRKKFCDGAPPLPRK
jgi:hypothetical protein